MEQIGKLLIITGFFLAAVGALFFFAGKVPFLGKLPGDFSVQKENFHFYFPLTTSIVISILLSLAMWIISSFRN